MGICSEILDSRDARLKSTEVSKPYPLSYALNVPFRFFYFRVHALKLCVRILKPSMTVFGSFVITLFFKVLLKPGIFFWCHTLHAL